MFQLQLKFQLTGKRMASMIIGNPHTFAIITQAVKEWNIEGSFWSSGVLLFCIDGALFPKQIATATLNSEI